MHVWIYAPICRNVYETCTYEYIYIYMYMFTFIEMCI